MATDLTTAPDHPATVLLTALNVSDEARMAGEVSASVLRAHEQVHGVTFAALDHDALQSVREAYEATTGDLETYASNLADAVRDLLGLE